MVIPGILTVCISLAHCGSCSKTGPLNNNGPETPSILIVLPCSINPELAAHRCAQPHTVPQV